MKINSNYNVVPANNNLQPSFKRNWGEHVSWGANYIKQQKQANFKLFSFPDAQAVFVEIGKDAKTKFGGIKDRLDQVLAALASLGLFAKAVETQDGNSTIYKMENKGDGVFEASGIPTEFGAQYRFIVAKSEDDIRLVKDPYSKQQPHINGWSEVYNSDNYNWQNTDWIEGHDSRRIVRKTDEPLRGLENLVIEEINIPTLSKEGTFEKAKAHIDKIAERGIATAIEIMPVENTFSLQWGYDGVDKFAVNSNMGTSAELKALIDYAHSKGLNVIMDMVPNHQGPDGNYLGETGPYLRKDRKTDWGDMFNYEQANNRYVRDFMVNAALWWANEYKVDGLRLDMTGRCDSDWLLRQIIDELNEHNPKVFTIAEDGNNNRWAITGYSRWQATHDEKLKNIDDNVRLIEHGNRTAPWEICFDSEWDFPLKDALSAAIMTPYEMKMDKLDEIIKGSAYRVKFLMSHDEIGNLDGIRLIPKVIKEELHLFDKVYGSSDAEKGQKAAQLAQRLLELCLTEDVYNMPFDELLKKQQKAGLETQNPIIPSEILQAFNIARAKQKLAMATVMTIPGPKMYFQGDDSFDISHFKFFRELSGDAYDRTNFDGYIPSIIAQKGYDTLESLARPDSILGHIKLRNPKFAEEVLECTNDLAKLVRENKALNKGDIVSTYVDNHHKVHTHHLRYEDEEVLVIKNFGGSFHAKEYGFANFPDGKWIEVFNSDKKEYGGLNYINTDREIIHANNQNLNLAPNSVVILKKI